eukprot:CAMPEP_0184294428 /NCGR_PEP_ID=MMETSP1049-20130417/5575_1 /TAXON_ID=77928 /ORGANISM="Proteomonas sulcata, Strain CCMP704" /LENGTH=62 /DNA_ID=CAMNT_0026602711 /DNA_START=684 /DNA_END=872 /DNA_ORIENTATION=+
MSEADPSCEGLNPETAGMQGPERTGELRSPGAEVPRDTGVVVQEEQGAEELGNQGAEEEPKP